MFTHYSILIFSVISVIITASKPTWKDLDHYDFERYVSDYNLQFPQGSYEWELRRSLFHTELQRVRAHNAKNLSWKEGINKFSILTTAEKKSFFGRSKGAARTHKPKNAKPFDYETLGKPIESLPSSVDWRDSGVMSSVKDQGYCGSCWAFASTAVVESHVAIASGLLFDLSVEQMAMCAPNPNECGGTGGCSGSTAELAFDYVASSSGLYEEYQYPYTSYFGKDYSCSLPAISKAKASISGYVQLPSNNYTALVNAVSTVGPVAISVDASSWSAYESGIYSGCNQVNPDIDHAVILAGYGEENGQKYWLVRNSWSPSWGEKGYIRLARFDTETEESLCGLDLDPSDGIACAGETDPLKVCGTCGVLFDSAYPIGASAV
eukprot:CAMPEP_0196762438 /NCGR_PEP_ID=MMETSP1095-20130614/1952_1 /TAXON_ID=96789 ORGANISM="Chromulina nebulosa, Strain UTEXLB2642" /NCGR_SAMPLE_ID=MMETSP1095 /ASSEMBLY_ACC=CAM_ASM_000446 /LENGTH=378 /DNA_ID=CAMNT_0042113331 /DNA_START=24 /DNA_END=1160 /DNA_ORIENTATION=-